MSPEHSLKRFAGFEGAFAEHRRSLLQNLQRRFVMSHKVRHLLKNTLDELYSLGKGTKRGELQRQMQKLTKRRESHFIHTSTTKVRYERAMMKFCDYLEERGIKRDKQLNRLNKKELQQIVDDYFKKLAKDGLSQNTIKIHIAAMEKSLAIVRPDIKPFITNDENRIGWWSAGRPSRKGDSYVDANAIRTRLKEEYRAIAEAQALGGFRVREIAKAKVDKEKYEITTIGKGGRIRTLLFEHRKEDFEKLAMLVEKLKEQHYEQRLKDYYRALKNACKSTGQEYHASHAFRREYAEHRIEELKRNEEERRELIEKYNVEDRVRDNNDAEREADAVLTQELGHNRLKMARYYYR